MNKKRNDETELSFSSSDSETLGADSKSSFRETKKYPTRWYVLIVFVAAGFFQSMFWNVWQPIMISSMTVFTFWHPSTFALLCNWSPVTFFLCVTPGCWLVHRKGLRKSFLLACGMIVIGATLRCINIHDDIFKWLVHISAILNGVAGVILTPAISIVSSTWFPKEERGFATGISSAIIPLGIAASFFISPLFVSYPGENGSPAVSHDEEKERRIMRLQIFNLMRFEVIFPVSIFLAMLMYFPAAPPTPPSLASALKNSSDFKDHVIRMCRSWNVWLLSISAALSQGVTGAWFAMMSLMLSVVGMDQVEIDHLGIWIVAATSVLSIIVAKISDIFHGNIKFWMMCLLTSSCLMFVFLAFLIKVEERYSNKVLISIFVLMGLSLALCNGCLYLELAAEVAYPVPEGIIGGFMFSMINISSLLIYLLFGINAISYRTLDLVLCLGVGLSIVCLMLCEEKYLRSSLDATTSTKSSSSRGSD